MPDNTPGPDGPATRRVVAWALIAALALAAPAGLLAGTVSGGGGRLVAVAVLALVPIGATAAWLHVRSRR